MIEDTKDIKREKNISMCSLVKRRQEEIALKNKVNNLKSKTSQLHTELSTRAHSSNLTQFGHLSDDLRHYREELHECQLQLGKELRRYQLLCVSERGQKRSIQAKNVRKYAGRSVLRGLRTRK